MENKLSKGKVLRIKSPQALPSHPPENQAPNPSVLHKGLALRSTTRSAASVVRDSEGPPAQSGLSPIVQNAARLEADLARRAALCTCGHFRALHLPDSDRVFHGNCTGSAPDGRSRCHCKRFKERRGVEARRPEAPSAEIRWEHATHEVFTGSACGDPCRAGCPADDRCDGTVLS